MAISSSDQMTSTEPETVIKEPEDDGADDDAADEGGGEPAAARGAEAKTPGLRPVPGAKQNGQNGTRRDRRGAFTSAAAQVEERVSKRVQEEMTKMRGEFSGALAAIRANAGGGQQQAASGGQQQDPYASAITDIEAAMASEMKAFNAHDHAKSQFDASRYNQLQGKKNKLVAEQTTIETLRALGVTPQMLQQMRQGGGRQPFDREAQMATRFHSLQQEFDWISDAKNAGAVGKYRNYLLSIGREDSFETDREAASHVASQLGLGRRELPRGTARMPPPGGGDRGDARGAREMRLPSAAIRGLSADEQKAVRASLFADE
jgi:hypothetical protein